MGDLISKSALKAVKFHPLPYTHIVPTDADAESYKWGWNDAIDAIIESAPTIDAVPVVRCKDCRFSVVNENIDRKPLICGKTKMCGETTPDWFCAAGERSESDEH